MAPKDERAETTTRGHERGEKKEKDLRGHGSTKKRSETKSSSQIQPSNLWILISADEIEAISFLENFQN
jgi:hypothetical protein